MKLLAPAGLLSILSCVTASPPGRRQAGGTNFHLPTSYAAFGDSYSAGIGAGHFLQTSADGMDNPCARFSGSYPYQLWKYNPFETPIAWRDFYSCSGNLLQDIDAQVAKLGGKKVDVVTLSISGNDFNFGNIVRACVYPVGVAGTDFQAACTQAMDTAQAAINNNNIWATYRSKVSLIQNGVLNPSGRLFITGYAKFFYPSPRTGDACDSIYFNSIPVIGNKLQMRAANRQRMNDLVDLVNQNIHQNVVNQINNPDVIWVDIDPFFEGFRFCEPANNADPIGSNNAHVWFNDIKTNLEETGQWNPPAANQEASAWATWTAAAEAQLPANDKTDPSFRPFFDNLQQASVFHPKTSAYQRVATQIGFTIIVGSVACLFLGAYSDSSKVTIGPKQHCAGSSPGGTNTCINIPSGCAIVNPIDNTVPTILCQNGTSITG